MYVPGRAQSATALAPLWTSCGRRTSGTPAQCRSRLLARPPRPKVVESLQCRGACARRCSLHLGHVGLAARRAAARRAARAAAALRRVVQKLGKHAQVWRRKDLGGKGSGGGAGGGVGGGGVPSGGVHWGHSTCTVCLSPSLRPCRWTNPITGCNPQHPSCNPKHPGCNPSTQAASLVPRLSPAPLARWCRWKRSILDVERRRIGDLGRASQLYCSLPWAPERLSG